MTDNLLAEFVRATPPRLPIDSMRGGKWPLTEGWRMYPFSEFDLPEEMKPPGEDVLEKKLEKTALAPRWLKNSLEDLFRGKISSAEKETADKAGCN